jgi:hypothetical protein
VAVLTPFALLGALVASAPAAADPPLSSVVLSDSLPGFVVSPPGPGNGPIAGSGSSSGIAGLAAQFLGGSTPQGYVRSWTRSGGDSAAIAVVRDGNSGLLSTVVGSLNHGLSASGATPFAVAGVSGASGFSVSGTAGGTSATSYFVDWVQGDELFLVGLQTSSGDVTEADAVTLASRQADHTGSSGFVTPLVLGLAAAAVVLLVVVVTAVVRRGRRRTERRAVEMGWPSLAPRPGSPPAGLAAPGSTDTAALRGMDLTPPGVGVAPAGNGHGSPPPPVPVASPSAPAGLPLLGAPAGPAPVVRPDAAPPRP